jgi:diguanylate cyclase (GGDEF)-like protein
MALLSVDTVVVLTGLWVVVSRVYPSVVGARHWAWSAAVTALGGALFIVLARVPYGVGASAADSLVVLGAGFAWSGIRRALGRPSVWGAVALIAGLTTAALFWYGAEAADTTRTIVFCVGEGLMLIFAGLELLRVEEPGRRVGSRIAGWTMVLCGLAQAVRIVFVTFGWGGKAVILGVTIPAPFFFHLVFMAITVWNFALLLMTIERLQEELVRRAVTDPLTGVGNRRFFMEQAERELARALRSARPFALLMMDLDHFKLINDAHGHDAGDAALQSFVACVLESLRPGDVLARYGGEEFCALLPETDAAAAASAAERIRAAIGEAGYTWGETRRDLTVSIGVAQWQPSRTLGEVISRADRALYEAKAEGRDRVVVATLPVLLAGGP